GPRAVAGHDSESATIVVQVPADAKVYIDNHQTQQTGTLRTFVTPAIPSGMEYRYNLKAEVVRDGKIWSKTERITVRAGQTTRVDLGDLSATAAGYLYTINNDPQRNGIVVLRRTADGSLTEVDGSPFPTGGKGLAGGDIDEQGAIRIHGEHVLAVNPGSDSIAVLRKGSDGKL